MFFIFAATATAALFAFFFTDKTAMATFDCLSLTTSSSQADKAYCQNELSQIEAQLAELLKKQQAQQKQTGTLKGDVDYLTSQINALKAKVKSRSLVIAQLKVSITEKVSKIGSLSDKIAREHEALAQMLRNINDYDNENFAHVVLSDSTLSEFYGDLESYNSIKEAVKESIDEIKGIKAETEIQKQDLEKKQDAELDARAELESAQKKVAQSEAEKKRLLQLSKQKESEYLAEANAKRARAAKIRSALFPLANPTQKIEFGTALSYAKEAEQKFGIDPAFLLAILTQESNLGANVGRCYLTHTEGPLVGYGVSITTGATWPNLMKPTRDVAPFLAIVGRLGLDPLKTAVSCPIADVAGYGGAMGPAQFIPSTWKLIENRLAGVLGHPANPWAPRDAFFASSIYLTDLGAIGSSYAAQIKAACKYYGTGGTSCSYGNSVMSFKAKIQADIDYLEQYGVAKQ